MCDAKPNATMTIKADGRRNATDSAGRSIVYDSDGNEITVERNADGTLKATRDGEDVSDWYNSQGYKNVTTKKEKDPTRTDNVVRQEYGLPPKKGPGLDITDKAVRDARMSEALRLRARRGRKASFLDADTNWADQRSSYDSAAANTDASLGW